MKEGISMEKTYDIKNLQCAHCGGKIETAVAGFDEVESAVLNFPLRKLKVSGKITPELERKMNRAAGKIEADVKIVPESGEKTESSGLKKEIITLAAGAVIYAAAIILNSAFKLDIPSAALYIAAYLLLGYEVIGTTIKNVGRGNIFDENFLMTIAAVGAFILGEYSEAVGVVLFFRIGEIFEDYAVNKSRRAITAAAGLKVDEAEILTEDGFVITSSQNIKIGDIIRVKPGERIAADGVVETGETRIDTSAVNGEPVPVSVRKGDRVISGCINLSEAITVRATAAAGDSMISKIADAVENASASKPKIDRFISRFAKVYTPAVIAIAALTAVIPSIITGEWQKWIYTALTFLVISCPCALVLSVPLAYFAGIGAASKLGILFKGGSSLEALGRVRAAAFDKTGTVTNGTFTVTDIKTCGISQQELLSLCGAAETASAHPVAESIVKYCKENSITLPQPERVREFSGRGLIAEVGGKTVLCGNEKLLRENGISIADSGGKVPGSVVYGAWDGKVQGRIIVSDTIKSKSAEAVKNLRAMGIYTALLTGDKEENAEITGEKLGMDSAKGGLMPEDKLAEIRKIREEHGAVMFVGDGINDGPVLAGADVGGAMHTGADLALEAADAVFMNPELDSVVRAKKIADRTLRISWENIVFALLIKAAVLAIGLLGHPSMWFAVFADSGTAMLLILNSVRVLRTKNI